MNILKTFAVGKWRLVQSVTALVALPQQGCHALAKQTPYLL